MRDICMPSPDLGLTILCPDIYESLHRAAKRFPELMETKSCVERVSSEGQTTFSIGRHNAIVTVKKSRAAEVPFFASKMKFERAFIAIMSEMAEDVPIFVALPVEPMGYTDLMTVCCSYSGLQFEIAMYGTNKIEIRAAWGLL